jgi:hypothetical protein
MVGAITIDLDSILIQVALEELADGHLALNRLGALKEDRGRELTIAERIVDLKRALKKNTR